MLDHSEIFKYYYSPIYSFPIYTLILASKRAKTMRRLVFILLSIYIFTSCTQKKKSDIRQDFIYIEQNKFKLNKADYFPLMLNYSVDLFYTESTLSVGPNRDYEIPKVFENHTTNAINEQIRGHFKLIKELGFNTIRLCTGRTLYYDKEQDSLKVITYINDHKRKALDSDLFREQYFAAFDSIFAIAASYNLKVMWLIPSPIEKKTMDFTKKTLSHFKDNASIFAYDFMNEPLYFDNKDLKNKERKKEDAYKIVAGWQKAMQKFAPDQLMTIGFAEPIEVFEWDPSILPVDFVQFHTYHPLRIPSEIYWYANYVHKPWLIGETALPADNDSIYYEEQRHFISECYEQIRACGGAGYGLWTFQEVTWGSYEHNHTGLMTREGLTYTKDSSHQIIGTLKPAAYEIAKLTDSIAPLNCTIPVNYYNMLGYNNYKLCGSILNKETGEPIEGALIRGWTANWKIGANTYTNENGEFTLYSNEEFVHFRYSAPGMSCERCNFETGTIIYSPKNDKTIPLDSLPNRALEYHSISHFPFMSYRIPNKNTLIDSGPYNFNFKPELFTQYKYIGQLGPLKLTPLMLGS